MTTIVVDNHAGFMAADRMAVSNDGDICIPCMPKIERIIGSDLDYLVGCAGHEGPIEIFLEWMREGDWDDPPSPMPELDDDYSFSAIILGEENILVVDKFMRPCPVPSRFYGIGTGGPLAWAILEAGVGIAKAMEVALKMDPNSGMDYDVVYLK